MCTVEERSFGSLGLSASLYIVNWICRIFIDGLSLCSSVLPFYILLCLVFTYKIAVTVYFEPLLLWRYLDINVLLSTSADIILSLWIVGVAFKVRKINWVVTVTSLACSKCSMKTPYESYFQHLWRCCASHQFLLFTCLFPRNVSP